MCGITGFFSTALSKDLLPSMLKSIVHRGPDDIGHFFSPPFFAGMTRLAINGLDDGNQPLYNENKDIALLYNGEIYNSNALKRELIKKGHHFSTHSDGEVICHLYEEKGLEAFKELDGMFAIALWIESEKKLILARDYIGEKPLYYVKKSPHEIVFSSEIKALQACKALSLSLNEQAIWDFPSFLWIPEPNTIFNEVKALPPGHLLIVTQEEAQLKPYVAQTTDLLPADFTKQEIAHVTQELVSEAVKSRLMAEVPLGCFLSGGLDSSIVTTLSAKQLGNINTFSIGFENVDDPYHGKSDESEEALFLAKLLGTEHHAIHVTAQDFKDLLPQFCHYGDQPFAVSSGLGILKIAQAAKALGVKVLLSGDGADEFFGGYSWYNYLSHATTSTNECAVDTTFQSLGLSPESRINSMMKYTRAAQAFAWHYYASEAEKRSLFSVDWYHERTPLSSIRHFDALNTLNNENFPLAFLENDRQFYFPNEMLTKVDRMCMAFSIESRVPFVSKKVTDWARSLPFGALVNNSTLKAPLRQGFKSLLPQEVTSRPKHGFNVPIDHWLKNEWHDLYRHTFSQESELFKRSLINKNAPKQADLMLQSQKLNGHTLFCYIMLNMWFENEYNRNYC